LNLHLAVIEDCRHRSQRYSDLLRIERCLCSSVRPYAATKYFRSLPNGDTVECNYLAHGHLGEQPQVVEVTPDKTVIWEISDHKHFKGISRVQLFDVPGDVTRCEVIR
jgi:hypothetical protein